MKRSSEAASGDGEVRQRRGIKAGEVALVGGEARSEGSEAPGSGASVDDDGAGGLLQRCWRRPSRGGGGAMALCRAEDGARSSSPRHDVCVCVRASRGGE